MRLLTALASLALPLAACSSSAQPAPAPQGIVTSSGQVGGFILDAVDGSAFPYDTGGVGIGLSSEGIGDACGSTPIAIHPHTRTLEMVVGSTGAGDHAVGTDVTAFYGESDDHCASTAPASALARDGKVTIAATGGGRIRGSYTLTFDQGSLSGTFDVPLCSSSGDTRRTITCE